ncbi:class I adenylate-forming enzyme family protein [Chloroflexota bacterium]
MVVGDIVTSNARLFPHKTGIVDDKIRLTWKQFNDRANRLANALLGLGLKKGDRVAIIAENRHEYAEFFFAVAKAGLITVCLNYRLTAEQLIRILLDCEPKALLIQDTFDEVLEPIKSAINSIDSFIRIGANVSGDYEYEALLAEYPPTEPNIEVQPEDIFRLQYTTGTTGTRKGAMLTHKNEINNCITRLQSSATFRDDVVINMAPLFAVGTQARFFSSSFLGATSVITLFSAELFVEMVERERVTYASLLPATTFRLVKEFLESSKREYDLSSLRKFQPEGGQHCSGVDLKVILDYFNIPYTHVCKPFGMTEAMPAAYLVPEDVAAGLSSDATEKEKRRLESVGKPLFNGKMRVVDDNDNDVPPGQTGEIILAGDQVMKGYWNNPELTARALRGGWFHTSDRGFIDEDGYLYFQGRKDFVIKSGGFLVGPEEVEDVILQLPAVAEAAVIGVPDEKWGQVVTAVVCLKPEHNATEEEIKAHSKKRLASFQVPRAVIFAEALPRDIAYGKLDRRALIRTYSGEV